MAQQDKNLYWEAMRLAGRAASRLKSPTDTDMARVFNVLFKTPKTNQSQFKKAPLWYNANKCKEEKEHWKSVFDHVVADLEDFSTSWEETTKREQTIVRIYADEGKRYKSDSFKDPTLFTDDENSIKIRVQSLTLTMARTAYFFGLLGNREKIVTMDLFARSWSGVKAKKAQCLKKLLDFGDSPPSSLYVDHYCLEFLPVTIIHEFMHSVPYGREDNPHKDCGSAGWKYCMTLTKKEACHDAECLALLSFMAGFADVYDKKGERIGGYTINRRWDQIPGNASSGETLANNPKWGHIWPGSFGGNPTLDGMLIFYKDITD